MVVAAGCTLLRPLWWLLLLAVIGADGYRLLMTQMVSTGSHELVLRNIGERLTERGHSVTQIRFLSAHNRFMPDRSPVNVISRTANNSDGRFPNYSRQGVFVPDMRAIWANDTQLRLVLGMSDIAVGYCENLLADRQLLQQLRQLRLDVAVVDTMGNQCGFALARLLRLPVIGFTVITPLSTDQGDFVSWLNPPSVATIAFSSLAPEKRFLDRVWNVLTHAVQTFLTGCLEMICRKVLKAHHSFSVYERLMQLPLVDVYLVNQNFVAAQSVVLPPNAHTLGSCRHDSQHDRLTTEMRKVLDAASHGAVIFSMGLTLYEPELIPPSFIQVFLQAFAALPQTVIMRIHLPQSLNSTAVPDNVHLVDWLPQKSALSHHNTRLFITHGGINGIMEGICHGVPMLVVPLFGDQHDNARLLKHRGFGLFLEKWSLNTPSLHSTINNIIHNNSFSRRVRRAARIWQTDDCPVDKVELWVRHLAEYGRPRAAPARTSIHRWAAPLAVGVMTSCMVSAAGTHALLLSLRNKWRL